MAPALLSAGICLIGIALCKAVKQQLHSLSGLFQYRSTAVQSLTGVLVKDVFFAYGVSGKTRACTATWTYPRISQCRPAVNQFLRRWLGKGVCCCAKRLHVHCIMLLCLSQGRNNARAVVTGSIAMFSNELFSASLGGPRYVSSAYCLRMLSKQPHAMSGHTARWLLMSALQLPASWEKAMHTHYIPLHISTGAMRG